MSITITDTWLWIFAGAFLITVAVNLAIPGKERRWRRFWIATLIETGMLCYAFAAKGL